MRALTLVATTLLTAAACGRADDANRRQTDSGERVTAETCLVPPPLVGLRLGDSISSVRAITGPPLDSVRSTEEDDGGRAASITYRFPRADVRVVRGRVDRIVVTKPGGWPTGLAVGSTQAEVDQYTARRRLLRMASADGAIEIAVCPDDRALLRLTPAAGGRRVASVELVASRP